MKAKEGREHRPGRNVAGVIALRIAEGPLVVTVKKGPGDLGEKPVFASVLAFSS